MANADLKQSVTRRTPARIRLQLVKATMHDYKVVQKQPERIRKYVQHDPLRYAA